MDAVTATEESTLFFLADGPLEVSYNTVTDSLTKNQSNSLMPSNEEFIGLVPAAGKGVRLGLPYPKELYPIIRGNRYKPVAQYVLDNLVLSGVKHLVFVINETKHQLIGYFGDGIRFGCHMSYVVQEHNGEQNRSTSPGLAHALDSAYHLTKNKTVFFGMADTIMEPENVFAQSWNAAETEDEVVLALFETSRPEKFGMVRMDAENRVLQINDKPRHTDLTLMWGCIIWRPRFTEHLHECVSQHGMTDFAQILNSAIGAGMRMRGVPMFAGRYTDLGTYDEILELDDNVRQQSQPFKTSGTRV
jgi:glucose-1-phosphate thymidylyltransferase